MASDDAIVNALDLLERANLGNPPGDGTAETTFRNVVLWRQVFVHVEDEELGRAVGAWLRKDTPWHPRAGELLALVAGQDKAEAACRALVRQCPQAPVGSPDRLQHLDRHTTPTLACAVAIRFGHPDDLGHGPWQARYRAFAAAVDTVHPDKRYRLEHVPGPVVATLDNGNEVHGRGAARRVLTREARNAIDTHMRPHLLPGGAAHVGRLEARRAVQMLEDKQAQAGPPTVAPVSRTPQAGQEPRGGTDARRAAALRGALERDLQRKQELSDATGPADKRTDP